MLPPVLIKPTRSLSGREEYFILKFLRIFFALISRKKALCDAEQSHLRLEQLFSQNLNRKALPVKIFGRSAMF